MVALFVIKLLTGIVLMWLLMPRKDVTDGFFRIQMLVALGLSVLVAMAIEPSAFTELDPSSVSAEEHATATQTARLIRTCMVAAAITAYLGHIFWKLGRRVPGNICIYVLGVLCILTLVTQGLRVVRIVPVWHEMFSDVASAGVLGATLTGMLLGHWYLTTPTMSIQPLKWFAIVLGIAAGLRLVASGVSLISPGFASRDTTSVLWLSVRLVGGIVVPAVTSVLVIRILKYRNTQSATGVLFAGLILVFMGEMSAALLERSLQIPF
jgi:hypothetical protein